MRLCSCEYDEDKGECGKSTIRATIVLDLRIQAGDLRFAGYAAQSRVVRGERFRAQIYRLLERAGNLNSTQTYVAACAFILLQISLGMLLTYANTFVGKHTESRCSSQLKSQRITANSFRVSGELKDAGSKRSSFRPFFPADVPSTRERKDGRK